MLDFDHKEEVKKALEKVDADFGVVYVTEKDAHALFTIIDTDDYYKDVREYVHAYISDPAVIVGMDWDVLREKFQDDKIGINIDQAFQVYDKTYFPDYYTCYMDEARSTQLVDKLVEKEILPQTIDRTTIEGDIIDLSKGDANDYLTDNYNLNVDVKD
jgi:hypothetical protein